MTSNLFQRPLRMLALGALCTAPLISMANNMVSIDRSDSVAHSSNAWLSRAAPGWAGDRSAVHLADSEHPMSFAHAARERVHGQPPAAAAFAHDGAMTHRDVWSASFLSDSSAPSPFASVTTPVPEPGTYVLMLAGLAAFGFVMRRRTRS